MTDHNFINPYKHRCLHSRCEVCGRLACFRARDGRAYCPESKPEGTIVFVRRVAFGVCSGECEARFRLGEQRLKQ